jgi:hypothetical protein
MNLFTKMWLSLTAKGRMKQRIKELDTCYIPRMRGRHTVGTHKVVDLDAAILLLSTVELKYDIEFTRIIEKSEGIAKVRKDWYKTRKGNIVCVSQIYGLDIQSLGVNPIEEKTVEELREEYNSTRMRAVIEDNMSLLEGVVEAKEEI